MTALTVTQVAGEERIERNHVYVIAPGTSLLALEVRDDDLLADA